VTNEDEAVRPISRYVPAYIWKELENHKKYVRIISVPAKIQMVYLSNTNQKGHELSQVAETLSDFSVLANGHV
jgi:hypothetical protein